MRRLSHLVTLSVIALLVLVPAAGAQQDPGVEALPVQGAWSVSIQDYFFDPADAAVDSGSTITWINNGDEPHTVTADNGLFDSGELAPGESYSVWFDGAGTVTYHCTIHPSMTGSVTVGASVQPATEQPATEQPATEQPATEQPATEQPATTGGY